MRSAKKNRIPKEDVDQVMREAIPVWEKYMANNAEMEEKALKGLALNCYLASAWLGDSEKATGYLNQIPEAKMSETNLDDDGSTSSGVTTLSFTQSAQNMFYFNKIMNDYKSRTAIVQ